MKKQKRSVWSLKFSKAGLTGATLFYALSLTPSLLPKGILFQALVSGVSMCIGYGLAKLTYWLWVYLQLPMFKDHIRKSLNKLAIIVVSLLAFVFTFKYVGWQNEIRAIFGMDSMQTVMLVPTILVTVLLTYLLLVFSRSVGKFFKFCVRIVHKYIPRRVSVVLGTGLALLFISFLINGVLVNGVFEAANQAFSVKDTRTNEGAVQPTSQYRSGTKESYAPWDTLGRQGRNFVSGGPKIDELNNFSGGGAIEPIRLYAGLKSSDTVQGRADIILNELIRTGAFNREVLVVVTTTGTGWLDPKAVDPLEYIYNGNSAIVGVQYSYLPSWISLLADQAKSKETSQVIFSTVHEYWSHLPADQRPELYIYGLSLGSFGAESIIGSVNIVNEPFNGALFSGPPFVNKLHANITANRDAGSSAWQPIYQNGRTVRFTAKQNALDVPTGEWEDTKIVYAQHATDPVVFFSFDLLLHEPDWLKQGQRGPDLTPSMRWYPFVTIWQVAGDLPAAGSVPNGFGHNYDMQANVESWVALTEPAGWTSENTANLKSYLANK